MAAALPQEPAFNLTYSQPSIDIGSGYAKGIGQAGASIADSIKNVSDIYQQNSEANDVLQQFSQMKDSSGNPILSEEDYKSLMQKGLGAKHAFMGELLARFHGQYQSQLDAAKQIQIAQATAATQAPYRMAEIAKTGEEQRKTALVNRSVTGERQVVLGAPLKTTSEGSDRIGSDLNTALNKKQSILDQPVHVK